MPVRSIDRTDRRRAGALLLLLLLGILTLLPASARAEEAKGSLELLEAGWDGNITAGAWAPVRVKVTGGSQDLDAMVEVMLEEQQQTSPTTTVRFPRAAYAQEVSLPANATKEVTVWVPTFYNLSGTVRLKAGQENLGEATFDFRTTKAPYWPLVGYLASAEDLGAALKKVEIPLQGLPTAINVARIRPEGLPALPEYMKGLRALVVQGNAPASLSDEQRQAVLQWVRGGGHLLLAGGPDLALTAAILPQGSLPVTFGGADRTVDLAPLLSWATSTDAGYAAPGGISGATGPAAPTGSTVAASPVTTVLAAVTGPVVRMQPTGGSILAGTAERPLAWRMGLGQGSVTLLAADPTLEPLASSVALVPLLKKAIAPALPADGQNEEDRFRKMSEDQETVYRLREGVQSLPSDAYPGWKQVALYLGGFALLAGPVIHLLFWNGRRRKWLWLAVPAASILVAGTIYVVGVTLGGRDMLGHTVSYVQIDPAAESASQQMMVGLYAPMHDDLIVTVDGKVPVNAIGMIDASWMNGWGPASVYGGGGGGGGGVTLKPPFRVITGRETRMEFIEGQWTMRPLTLSRTLGKETGKIASTLRLEGDLIKGSVTNETPYHLEDAAVAVGSQLAKLGSLKPGESVEVTLEPAANPTPFNHYLSLPLLLYGKPITDGREAMRGPMPPGAPEPMELLADPEIRRRSTLLEALLSRPRYGPESLSLPLTFVAFTQDKIGASPVDLKGHPDHHLNLIQQRLQLDLPPGPFRMGSALIPSEVTMNNIRGMGSGSDGSISWMEIDSGNVVYSFLPPLPKGAAVTALTVTTRQLGPSMPATDGRRGGPMGMPQPAEAGIFQIYNWSTAAWEDLPAGAEEVRLANPAPYVGAEGQVRVQVVAGGKVVRFFVPQLSLEGRGAQ